MNNTPSASPKKTPTAASATAARKHMRVNAIWLMNAATLALTVAGVVAGTTSVAKAGIYAWDANGSNSAGFADYGNGGFGGSSASLKTTGTVSALNSYALSTDGTSANGYFGNSASDIALFGLSGYTTATVGAVGSGSSTGSPAAGGTSAVRFGTSAGGGAPTAAGAFVFQKMSGAAGTNSASYLLTAGTAVDTLVDTVTLTGGALKGSDANLSTTTGSQTSLSTSYSWLTSAAATSPYGAGGGITILQKSDVLGSNRIGNTVALAGSSASATTTTGGIEFSMANNQAFVNLSTSRELIINVRLFGSKALNTFGDITLGGGNTNGGQNAFSGINIDAGTLTLAGAKAAASGTAILVAGSTAATAGSGTVSATLRATGGVSLTNVSFTGSTTNANSFGNVTVDAHGFTSTNAGYAYAANNTAAATSVSSASSKVGNVTLVGNTSTTAASYTLTTGSKLTAAAVSMQGNSNLTFSGTLAASSDTGLVADSFTTTNTGNLITLSGSLYTAGTYRILTVTAAPVMAAGSLSLTGSGVNNLSIAAGNSTTQGRTSYSFGTNASNASAYDLVIAGSIVPVKWTGASGTWTSDQSNTTNWQKTIDSSADNFYSGDAVTFNAAATVTTSGTIDAGALTISNDSGVVAISGTQVGATALTKSGAGSATIGSVANTGITTVSNGSLTLSGGTLTGAITVSGGTLTSSATGSGGVTVSGGTMTANAAISGGATVNTGGTLAANAQVSDGVTASGGTLNYGVNNATAGNLTVSSGGTVALGAYNGSVGTVTLTDGSITGSGTLTSSAAYVLSKGSISAALAGTSGLTKSTADTVTLSGSNTLTGTYTVSAGTLELNGSNTPTSVAVSNTGTLKLGNDSALGNAGVTVAAGGSIDLNSRTLSKATGTLTISGTGASTALGALGNSAASAASYTGTVSLAANATIGTSTGGDITLNGVTAASAYILTITGDTTSTKNVTLKNISGSLEVDLGNASGPFANKITLDGTNTNTGDLRIYGGTVQVNGINALSSTSSLATASSSATGSTLKLQAGADATAVVYNANILKLTGGLIFDTTDTTKDTQIKFSGTSTSSSTATSRKLKASAGVTVNFDGGFNLGNLTGAAGNKLTLQGAGNFIFGNISNGGGFATNITLDSTDAFTGVAEFKGTNTFTGAILINSGTLKTSNSAALGVGSNTVTIASGGNLDLNGMTFGGSNTNALTISGSTSNSGLINSSLTNTATYTGTINATGNAVVGSSSGGSIILSGVVSVDTTKTLTAYSSAGKSIQIDGKLTGLGTIKVSSSGKLLLTNATNDIAAVEVGSGTISVSNDAALGAGTVNFGTQSNSILAYTDDNSNVTRAFTIGAASLAGAAYTANIDVASGKAVTLNGIISDKTSGWTGGKLNKTGSGTLTLGGANTYSGATTVSAGTLTASVSGALASTASIAVNGAIFNAVDFNSTAGLTLDSTGTATISGTDLTVGVLSNANTTTSSLNFNGSTGKITAVSLAGAGNTRFGSDATITGGISEGSVSVVGALTSTAVTGGTVSVGAGSTIDEITTGTLNVNGNTSVTALNGGTVSIASGKTLTVTTGSNAGAVSGDGALKVDGSGTLYLTNANNSYTGGTTIATGTISVGNDAALGASAGVVTFGTASDSKLAYTASSTTARSFAIGDGYTGKFDIASGATVETTGSVTGSDTTGGSLTKLGNGTLKLQGTNSYKGATTVSAGALELTGSLNNSAFTVSSGATAKLNYSFGNTLAVSGALTLDGTLTIDLGTKISTLSAADNYNVITFGSSAGDLANNIVLSGTLTNNDWVISGGLVSGSNIYRITVSAAFVAGSDVTGTLTVPAGQNVGEVKGSAAVTVSSTGTTISKVSAGSVTVGADAAITDLSGGAVTINSGKMLTVTSGDSAGTLAGSGTLAKTGTGTLKLSGDNSAFVGAAQVAQGTLEVTGSGALGSATNVDLGASGISNAATLKVTSGTSTNISTAINAKGSDSNVIQNAGAGALELSGSLTKDGTVLTLAGGSAGITVSGVIGGSSANSDLVISGGTTTLTNVNTYNGPTYVRDGGTLVNGNASGALPTGTNLVLGSGTTSGTFNLNGNNQSITNLNTSGTAGASNVVTNNGSADAALTVTAGGTFDGKIQDGSTKLTSLVLTGGTLELTGANTYSGGTYITGTGVLAAGNASALGSGSVSVASGAILDAGAGSSALTLTTGGYALSDGAILRVYIGSIANNSSEIGSGHYGYYDQSAGAGSSYSYFNTAGTLDLSGVTMAGGITVQLMNDSGVSLTWEASKRYDFTFMTFGNYTGLASGLSISELFTFDLTQLSVNGLPAGAGANLQNWGADAFMKYNSGTITMSIPEPSTYGIGLGALALAFAAIRRRQIKAKKEIA